MGLNDGINDTIVPPAAHTDTNKPGSVNLRLSWTHQTLLVEIELF